MLCGPLCDAVTDGDGLRPLGKANLQWLEDGNLLDVPGRRGLWYRYHHLFQGLLAAG